MRNCIIAFGLLIILSVGAAAQSHELGFVGGGKFTPSGTSPTGQTKVNSSFGFEVSYANQLISGRVADLELEVPIVAVPNSRLNATTNSVFTAKSYSSLYFLPGLRVRLGTHAPLSPWAAAGVGLVHFSPSSTNLGGGPSGANSSTKAGFDVGGGVDVRFGKSPLALRGEIRELYTGVPNLAVPKLSMHNNFLAGGGIVLRF